MSKAHTRKCPTCGQVYKMSKPRWSTADDRVVLDDKLTSDEMAAAVGRTPNAVRTRRSRLKKARKS